MTDFDARSMGFLNHEEFEEWRSSATKISLPINGAIPFEMIGYWMRSLTDSKREIYVDPYDDARGITRQADTDD